MLHRSSAVCDSHHSLLTVETLISQSQMTEILLWVITDLKDLGFF